MRINYSIRLRSLISVNYDSFPASSLIFKLKSMEQLNSLRCSNEILNNKQSNI